MISAPQCRDVTVDVGILMTGSGIGNPEDPEACRGLMHRIESAPNWMLALDKRGKIRHQYENKLKEGTLGHHWLRNLAEKNRIRMVPWTHLDRGVVTALKEAHFDSAVREDFKYVVTAASTECKILSSHDSDYSIKVCRILKRRLAVLVHRAQECLDCY